LPPSSTLFPYTTLFRSLQSGRTAEALSLLSKFDDTFPESLLIRDAHVLYAGALITANRAKEAAVLLEKDREPIRADLELTLGRRSEEHTSELQSLAYLV